MKPEKKNPRHMYLGNLFIVHNGVGTVSNIKYAVIRKKSHYLSRAKYFAYPGEREVLVGSYEVSNNDEDIPFLINSIRLSDIVGYQKITSQQVCAVILENNDPKELKKVMNGL